MSRSFMIVRMSAVYMKRTVTDISTTSAEVIFRVVYTMGIIPSTQINAFNHTTY